MSGGAGLLPSTGWSDLLRRYFPEISVWNLFPQNTTSKPELWHPKGGSRYTQYTKLYDILYVYIYIHCNNQITLNWGMTGRTKRRRTRGFWRVQGSTLLLTSGPEVVGCHWGCGLFVVTSNYIADDGTNYVGSGDVGPYQKDLGETYINVNSTNHSTSLWGLSNVEIQLQTPTDAARRSLVLWLSSQPPPSVLL